MKKNAKATAIILIIVTMLSLLPYTTIAAAGASLNILVAPKLVYNSVYPFVNGLAIVTGGEYPNQKKGAVDKYGNVVVPFEYDGLESFYNSEAAWAYKNGKTGRIDNKGNVIVPFIYDWHGYINEGRMCFGVGEDYWEDMKFGVCEVDGKVIIPAEYSRPLNFSDGYALTSKGAYPDEKAGVIDMDGNIIIPFKYEHLTLYDDVIIFNEGRYVTAGGFPYTKYGLLDLQGNVILQPDYDYIGYPYDGLFPVQKGEYPNTKYGYIDKTGKVVIPVEYDDAYHIYNGLIRVKKNDKYGYIDLEGKIVAPLEYEQFFGYSYEDLSWAKKDGSWGLFKSIISAAGAVVSTLFTPTPVYEEVYFFSEGLARVGANSGGAMKYGFCDEAGSLIIPMTFDSASAFNGRGYAAVGAGSGADMKLGVIDKSGKVVIKPEYEELHLTKGWFATVGKGEWRERKYGAIDETGKVIVPLMYDNISFFSDGFATVRIGSWDKGKYGLLDSSGKIVLPVEYDAIYFFSEGVAWVVKDGLFGIIEAAPGSGSTTPPAPPPAALAANPTASTVLVNGVPVAFDAYNINDNNYFKLRDLAYVLTDTEKCFEVDWDGEKQAISLTSGQAYTVVGGEMEGKGSGVKTPVPSNARVYLDGDEILLTAYNIDGNNYFKLRDIGGVFDFGVDWDGAAQTIAIDTSKGYTPE